MVDTRDNLPLDTRLLSDAIIELNISRHNVSIYPKNHPIVEKSINQVFSFLQKIFEMRKAITLAIAKDTIIIDTYFLDRQNPVYKDFAGCLSRRNIASVTFISGLTKDELYSFHHFISKNIDSTSSEDLLDSFMEYETPHIKIMFIDFSAFNLVEEKTDQEDNDILLWEKYVFGLLEGRLEIEDRPDGLQEIPPDLLAGLINKASTDNIKEENYEKVIASYVRKTTERAFSASELKDILDFINKLRPELKKDFLSSAVSALSRDLDSVRKSLGDMPVDTVIELLNIINEQMVAIPEALKNILDEFARMEQKYIETPHYKGSLVEDDICLSPEITGFLKDADFKSFVSDSYQQEIQRLIKFNADETNSEWIKEFEREWSDEYIENVFHQIVLEFTFYEGLDIIPQDDYELFINILKEQAVQFIYTGQYKQVRDTFMALETNTGMQRSPDLISNALTYYHSPQFISLLVGSIRIMGRKKREDVMQLCEYYGEKIIPPLIEALTDEESQATRRFIISLITHFGEKAIPEVVRHLDDGRWFVKRNMLFILHEYSSREALQNARAYCDHEDPRVSFEAIKCLLKAGDSDGVRSLRNYLRSESRESVRKAISLSGAFRVNDVVPDLIQMLNKKSITGIASDDKIPIVKALGQIGDPRALDTLRKMLSAKTLLFKGHLEKLREEIGKTLANYPYEDAKDLIAMNKTRQNARKG